MTVKELRSHLQRCPDQAVVVLQIGEIRIVDLSEVVLLDASGIDPTGSSSMVSLRDKAMVLDDPR